ncbi:hypothetical protein AGRA3207_000125 [Actinomadura graeca]|uniref:MotA/TolQ/ExbB proton channel domain-containing protein n=1 Tax=Actinomadura graeca TaxID=2750812 RepID=A0ABX8QLN5_9ACTN|nr:hypothetical protein [Actinomadura graeca]QXJ19566.1 hypothetical protein AGRA3207_000125 [Actinomadura graeca]
MTATMIAIVCGIAAGLAVAELSALASTTSRKIIIWSARQIYAHDPAAADGYAEEWAGGVAGQTSNIAKLATALRFSIPALTAIARRAIRRTRQAPRGLGGALADLFKQLRDLRRELAEATPTAEHRWLLLVALLGSLTGVALALTFAGMDVFTDRAFPSSATVIGGGGALGYSTLSFVVIKRLLRVARPIPLSSKNRGAQAGRTDAAPGEDEPSTTQAFFLVNPPASCFSTTPPHGTKRTL